MKSIKNVCSAALVAAVAASTAPASAYQHKGHQLTADLAWQVMVATQRSDLLTIPDLNVARLDKFPGPGAEPPEWREFILDIDRAIALLSESASGLDVPKASGAKCKEHLGSATAPYPNPGDVTGCRLRELQFSPAKEWFDAGEETCPIEKDYTPGGIYELAHREPIINGSFRTTFDTKFVGTLLGRLATIPDDDVKETTLWQLNPALSLPGMAASKSLELGLAVALALPVCIVSLFTGDNCWDKAKELANDVNLAQTLLGSVPGDPDSRMNEVEVGGERLDFIGFWHLMQLKPGSTAAANLSFNDVPGLMWEQGGPLGSLGTIDLVGMAFTDINAIHLNVPESNGVRRYEVKSGPSQSRSRSDAEWASYPVGHIEMNPLDNLAQAGVSAFTASNIDLSQLARPLHALGDATVPMHTMGTSGWGHSQFEGAIEGKLREILLQRPTDPAGKTTPYTSAELSTQLEQARRILKDGFRWWKRVRELQRNEPQWGYPIRPFLTELATETANRDFECLNNARGDSDFQVVNTDACVMRSPISSSNYKVDIMRPPIEAAAAANLAFLTTIASFAKPLATTAVTPCTVPAQTCGTGLFFNGKSCFQCNSPDRAFHFAFGCYKTCPVGTQPREYGNCVVPENGCANGTVSNGAGGCVACGDNKFSEGNTCVSVCSGTKSVLAKNCVSSCPASLRYRAIIGNTASGAFVYGCASRCPQGQAESSSTPYLCALNPH
ncbi:MAG TPA: hypothetical protein VFQ61_27860 [Polyangiaceae bacterium]|nr:hypothetical protein [Polyangiaceae bacterium]